jgi:hypothetical protein
MQHCLLGCRPAGGALRRLTHTRGPGCVVLCLWGKGALAGEQTAQQMRCSSTREVRGARSLHTPGAPTIGRTRRRGRVLSFELGSSWRRLLLFTCRECTLLLLHPQCADEASTRSCAADQRRAHPHSLGTVRCTAACGARAPAAAASSPRNHDAPRTRRAQPPLLAHPGRCLPSAMRHAQHNSHAKRARRPFRCDTATHHASKHARACLQSLKIQHAHLRVVATDTVRPPVLRARARVSLRSPTQPHTQDQLQHPPPLHTHTHTVHSLLHLHTCKQHHCASLVAARRLSLAHSTPRPQNWTANVSQRAPAVQHKTATHTTAFHQHGTPDAHEHARTRTHARTHMLPA